MLIIGMPDPRKLYRRSSPSGHFSLYSMGVSYFRSWGILLQNGACLPCAAAIVDHLAALGLLGPQVTPFIPVPHDWWVSHPTEGWADRANPPPRKGFPRVTRFASQRACREQILRRKGAGKSIG